MELILAISVSTIVILCFKWHSIKKIFFYKPQGENGIKPGPTFYEGNPEPQIIFFPQKIGQTFPLLNLWNSPKCSLKSYQLNPLDLGLPSEVAESKLPQPLLKRFVFNILCPSLNSFQILYILRMVRFHCCKTSFFYQSPKTSLFYQLKHQTRNQEFITISPAVGMKNHP